MRPDRAFYEEYARSYSEEPVIRMAQIGTIGGALAVRGAVGLDVGCGRGQLLASLSRKSPRLLVGCDWARTAVEAARQKIFGEPPRGPVVFHVCDARNLPFPDGTFDFVVCTEVLEHVEGWEKAFGELRRVLKPGGVLALSVPNILSPAELLHTVKHLLGYVIRGEPITHLNRFTYWTLRRACRDLDGYQVHGLHFATAFLPARRFRFFHRIDALVGRALPWFAFDLLIIGQKN